jgi:hypothetical protein
MKYKKTLLAIGFIACVFLAGCQEEQAEPTVDTTAVNRKIVDTYSDLAIQNAIIAQHTLYPYHFVNNSPQLNTLGERDLSVLIEHFKDNPGRINVQQGGIDSSLYQSRTQTVYEKMLAGGIPDTKIQIASGMPGGEGISSNAVIEILDKDKTTDTAQGYEMDVAF